MYRERDGRRKEAKEREGGQEKGVGGVGEGNRRQKGETIVCK